MRTPHFPATHWEHSGPAKAGRQTQALQALAHQVGGCGCVIREGRLAHSWGDGSRSQDVASACKPVISTLMLMAVQEKLLPSPDSCLSDWVPPLKSLNGGKEAAISFHHLAHQLSGYGLVEAPGAAYSYNDFALALYYDTLMERIFQAHGSEVLRQRLAGPLGFEDACSFEAFGPGDRPGRLAISARDLARFGLLILRGGQWHGQQLLHSDFIQTMRQRPVRADMPLTTGGEMPMLPGQRTLGGGKNITPLGPGFYCFNWWLNGLDLQGRRLMPAVPPDGILACGHGGRRVLLIVPSLELVVSWNQSAIQDFDLSPGSPDTQFNRAVSLACTE